MCLKFSAQLRPAFGIVFVGILCLIVVVDVE